MISACVYIINDVVDAEKDRLHPKKKLRPIASGMISKTEALVFLAVLLPVAVTFAFMLDTSFALVLLCILQTTYYIP